MIKAKSVISNKFWILRDNDHKIGEVSELNGGYTVNIKNRETTVFRTLALLEAKTGIKFSNEEAPTVDDTLPSTVHGYPISGEAHNAVWNTELELPLYNKKKMSKSWFAAGYYIVKIKDEWRTEFSPKLIILQRNDYHGPYYSIPQRNS
jgi:hypothetical protein